MKLFAPGWLLLISALTSIAPAAEPAMSPPDTGNLKYAEFTKIAADFDEVVVWEGLPSPAEKSVLEKERATKKTFQIGEQYFYAQPLTLTDAEKTALSDAILKHRENFKKWSGTKLCGGFHADYAVEWRQKGTVIAQALFCFSCEEVEFRTGARTERIDQNTPVLGTLLQAHHDQRPPRPLSDKKP